MPVSGLIGNNMLYVLSEDELKDLRDATTHAKTYNDATINKLCRMVADHMPITKWPGSEESPAPWGCRRSKDYEWYCDNCPVLSYCKATKEFSK